MSTDYYDLLGVPKDASASDIKKAFRQIARECHPDVSGGDPAAEERFKKARNAYETLMDPVTRARYDRRGQRRAGGFGAGGGSFFDAFYKATGQNSQPKPHRQGGRKGKRDPGNDMGLDDLFNVGEFGFGSNTRGRQQPGATPPPRPAGPQPGGDIDIVLDVPVDIAARGGSVTAVYHRMQRSDSWRPGAGDDGLVRVQDIADIRIVPGSRDGMVLRERGLGDAGPNGGTYGDLVATVRLVERVASGPSASPPWGASSTRPDPPRPPRPTPPKPPPTPASPAATPSGDTLPLEIGVVEALLGGRVELETPQGMVRLTIPPGTSGGTRMRLKGKGAGQADLYVEVRIRVPRTLDDESRRLIEEFARLNP
jgi:DnaJ-class molecular chaperone